MKPYNLSMMALLLVAVIFGYVNQVYAEDSSVIPIMKVLWQKEVTPDINLDCSLGPVIFDKTDKRLLVTGTSFRPKVYSEGKFWLLEVDASSGGIARKTTIKEVNESKATLMLAYLLISSLTVSENSDVTLVGKFDNLTPSIMKINRGGNTSKFIELADKDNDGKDFSLIHGGINFSSGNLLLMGGGRDGGLVTKIDSEGNRLWERSYRIGQGQVDSFNDGLSVEGNEEFVIVGCSANVKGKFPDVIGDDFIVRCNTQGDVIAKDIFTGNPWPGEQPQICQVSSGDFIVVYGKGMQFKRSDIDIRAYSSGLKFLWEKQAVKSEECKPSTFNITAKPRNGFIVAANVDFGNLRVFEYDGKGNQIANLSKDKEVWVGNVGLACMDKKAFVVFQTRPNTVQGEELSRIKIIALGLK